LVAGYLAGFRLCQKEVGEFISPLKLPHLLFLVCCFSELLLVIGFLGLPLFFVVRRF